MPKFVKDVLYPGTYSVPTDDGKGRRKVRYTADDVRHLRQRVKDMVKAGLQIPVAWNHQDDAKPVDEAEALANRSKFNLGFVEDADLTPEGYLTTRLDVPGDDDAKRLPSVRFASPEITKDYVDGSGRKWPGLSITHVAVTARPVQAKQQPFQPVQMGLDVVRLSLVDRLGESDMADEEAPKKGEEEVSGDGPGLKKVLEGLAGYGITLPDDTTDENFMDRLLTALKALSAAKDGDTDTGADEVEGTEEDVPPVAMSLDKRLKSAEARLVTMERADLRRRVNALYQSGRINKPIRDKLLNQANAVQLSLDSDGNTRPNSLTAKVEAYEELGEGNAWSGDARLSMDRAREVAPPARLEGRRPESPTEVQSIVDGWDEAMGRKK